MKTIRSGFSTVLILVALAGLTVLLIGLFSSANSSPTTLGSSPVATLSGVQISPLPTPNVPLARIGSPVLLQGSEQVVGLAEGQDKLVTIAGQGAQAHTALVDPVNGATQTIASTVLINAHVAGHWLVYEDHSPVGSSAYYSRIRVRELNSGQEIALGDENAIQVDSDISRNIIVWDEPRNGKKASIYAYDLATNKTLPISVGEGVRGYPRISGQWIAYIQWPGQNPTGRESEVELHAHSLATGEDLLIWLMLMTNDSLGLSRYAIDGNKIAWTKLEAGGQYLAELHLYDLTTHTDRRLTEPTNGWPANISLSSQAGVVVYKSAGQGWAVLDWLQPTPTPLSLTPPINSQWGYELSVAGDYLVWQIQLNREASDGKVFVTKIVR